MNAFALAAFALCFFACKKSTPPTVTISNNISVTQTSANVTGEVTNEGSSSVTERGFIYGKQGESRQDTLYCGSGLGEFPTRLTGLEPNTTYNCSAFAKNDGGVGTSGKVTFTTRDHNLPIVSTSEVESVGTTTASCGGNVTDDGGAEVTEKGKMTLTVDLTKGENIHGKGIVNRGIYVRRKRNYGYDDVARLFCVSVESLWAEKFSGELEKFSFSEWDRRRREREKEEGGKS